MNATQTTENETTEAIRSQYVAGCEFARNLKPGDVFRGSLGEADHSANGNRFFALGYMHELKSPVVVDNEGRIVSIG